MAEKIRKRDGTVVDFDASKIKIAVAKAISAVRGGVVDAELNKIMSLVVTDMFIGKAGAYPFSRRYLSLASATSRRLAPGLTRFAA